MNINGIMLSIHVGGKVWGNLESENATSYFSLGSIGNRDIIPKSFSIIHSGGGHYRQLQCLRLSEG